MNTILTARREYYCNVGSRMTLLEVEPISRRKCICKEFRRSWPNFFSFLLFFPPSPWVILRNKCVCSPQSDHSVIFKKKANIEGGIWMVHGWDDCRKHEGDFCCFFKGFHFWFVDVLFAFSSTSRGSEHAITCSSLFARLGWCWHLAEPSFWVLLASRVWRGCPSMCSALG